MTTAPMSGSGSLPQAKRQAASRSLWEQWSPVGGVLFTVLLVVGWFIAPQTPDDAKPQDWVNYYADSGNRMQQIIGAYLMILAAFAFLWFAMGIVQRLRRAEGSTLGLRSITAGAAGLLTVILLFVFSITFVSVSGSVSFGGANAPNPEFGIQFEQLAFGLLLIPGMLSAALFIAVTSSGALATGLYARWFAYTGFVFAVLLLLSPIFLPVVLFVIWPLIAGVLMLTRSSSIAPS